MFNGLRGRKRRVFSDYFMALRHAVEVRRIG